MFALVLATMLLAAQVPAPATPSDDPTPDVVVMAHKLKRLRLRYAADGRSLRWCRAEVSSGDPKLDHVGCEVLGWCVRRGFDEQDRALACLHWFQAQMDKRAKAEEDRRLASSGNNASPPTQQP
jgi:hypothetical protein